jgi:hypothetical protein
MCQVSRRFVERSKLAEEEAEATADKGTRKKPKRAAQEAE